MKTFIIAAALSLAAFPALAQTSAGSNSNSGAVSQSGVSIANHSARQAPSAIAPGLIASGLSCSGSASVGGSGGGWGIGLGITREDKSCNAREDAKYIQGVVGSANAAKERLCDTREIREAFRRAGEPCMADMNTQVRSASSVPALRSSQPAVTTQVTFRNMAQCRSWARQNGKSALYCQPR